MIKDSFKFVSYGENIELEYLQCMDEGLNVDKFKERVKKIKAMDPSSEERETMASKLFEEMENAGVQEDYRYFEPSDLDTIKKERPVSQQDYHCINERVSKDSLYEKVYGAWLGRCSGCLLGKPVEGWKRERLTGFMKDTDNYPFKFYLSSDVDEKIKQKYEITNEKKGWINLVSCMPEDDDINYTIIGLKILEQYGRNFVPDDVASMWLSSLPIYSTWTAERMAYKNLVNCIFPPESATYKNPFREWIGAMIRADIYGYVNPGRPELAAEMAWKDASISHVKNGIYGEMFIAAMIAAAFITNDICKIIKTGLSQIPRRSRLAEAINKVFVWYSEGLTWEEAIDRVHSLYNENCMYDWTHVISNALIVVISLLYGEMDFEKSIGIAVTAGFDTDCNGATVGSILGVVLGSNKLPSKWILPLNDRVNSGVKGFSDIKISELAARTVNIMKTL